MSSLDTRTSEFWLSLWLLLGIRDILLKFDPKPVAQWSKCLLPSARSEGHMFESPSGHELSTLSVCFRDKHYAGQTDLPKESKANNVHCHVFHITSISTYVAIPHSSKIWKAWEWALYLSQIELYFHQTFRVCLDWSLPLINNVCTFLCACKASGWLCAEDSEQGQRPCGHWNFEECSAEKF